MQASEASRVRESTSFRMPMDDAALHHVFDGGWMWVLRFGNGVTSAGIAVTDDLAAELRLADGEPAWHRFLLRSIRRSPRSSPIAQPTREFTWMPRLSWRVDQAAAMDGRCCRRRRRSSIRCSRRDSADAARHRATGANSGSARGASLVRPRRDVQRRLIRRRHARRSRSHGALHRRLLRGVPAIRAVRRLLDVLFRRRQLSARWRAAWASTRGPAASWRRPAGVCAKRRCVVPAIARHDGDYRGDIAGAIDPLNIAGLAIAKRNWYRVDFKDTVRAAESSESRRRKSVAYACSNVDRVVAFCRLSWAEQLRPRATPVEPVGAIATRSARIRSSLSRMRMATARCTRLLSPWFATRASALPSTTSSSRTGTPLSGGDGSIRARRRMRALRRVGTRRPRRRRSALVTASFRAVSGHSRFEPGPAARGRSASSSVIRRSTGTSAARPITGRGSSSATATRRSHSPRRVMPETAARRLSTGRAICSAGTCSGELLVGGTCRDGDQHSRGIGRAKRSRYGGWARKAPPAEMTSWPVPPRAGPRHRARCIGFHRIDTAPPLDQRSVTARSSRCRATSGDRCDGGSVRRGLYLGCRPARSCGTADACCAGTLMAGGMAASSRSEWSARSADRLTAITDSNA